MKRLVLHLVRTLVLLLLGGFLGATLVRLAPGFGVDERELDSRLSDASVQALRQSAAMREGLPAYYWHAVGRLLHGDLGYSRTMQEPVNALLADRFPETLKTVALGLALAWALGLTLAVLPELLRSRSLDLFAGLTTGLLLCVPAAMLGLLFLLARAPGRLVVGMIVFPKVYRYARNLVQQSASRAHVVTAWAKGLGAVRVVLRHVLPLAAPQLLALAGVTVTLAFAAAVPVEVICDLPGIGQLAWKAALGRDMELLVSLTLIVTLITLVVNSVSGMVPPSGHNLDARTA